jgi:hypothetical protein
MPNPTDEHAFIDDENLDNLLDDARATDTVMVSSLELAQSMIEDFRNGDDTSPWLKLNRQGVADRLSELIQSPRLFQQGSLNLCGPATFFCIWTARDPVGFVTFAGTLFDIGVAQIGTLEVRPDQALLEQDFADMLNRMATKTGAADWMVLGALRNSTNVFWQGSWQGDPAQELAGLTRPKEVAEWLNATGIYASVHDEGNWIQAAGIPHAEGLEVLEGRDTALLIHMNLINADINNQQEFDHSFILNQFPNHYVMLLGPIVSDLQSHNVRLSVWTWGKTLNLEVPQQAFIENYYGAIYASLP